MALHATVRFASASDPFPATISGRKLLDQNGQVFLMLTASSWSLADLADAGITAVLEGLEAAGFNAVTVWGGGGYQLSEGGEASWLPPYERKSDSSDWWTGTPWASPLGDAWDAMDHIAAETLRLGMVLNFSFGAGYALTGAGVEWEAATNTNMHDVGVAVAGRYPIATYPNIVWHFMLDDGQDTTSTRGQRIRSLFDGINDTEGASTRPIRWMEPNNGATTNSQGWLNEADTKVTINSIYEYSTSHTVEVETGYAEAAVPVCDCEPPYDGSSNAGSDHLGLRNRVAAVFLEGGCLINWGHENLWTFGKTGFFTEGLTYTQVLTHSATLHAGYIFALCQQYCAVTDWAPTSSFVTTGEGTTTAKAAIGACSTAALAYFPNTRPITVDTQILAGTGNVRLRWFDPTAGTYTTIAASEAQQSRSVTHPGNTSNSASSSDWILVADLV